MNRTEVLENGTVVEAHDTCLAVEVEGVEVFVGTKVNHRSCGCCGTTAELDVSYNRAEADRIEKHGEADPLDLHN